MTSINNLEDLTTLPISSLEELDSQPIIEDFENNQRYNNQYNNIFYNKEKGLHEFFSYAFGDSRQSNSTFYVYYNGVEVYNIDKPAIIKYIRLVKKSDGTTDIVIDE